MVALQPDTRGEHVRKLIRACLERSAAASLDTLVDFSGFEADCIEKELATLLASGEVEVLRPVAGSEPRRPERAVDFYRRVTADDRRYVWEKEIHTKPRRDELSDLKQAWMKLIGTEGVTDIEAIRAGLSSVRSLS